MTAKVRHVDFYASEWLEGTAELSEFDRGIYITICALIWARGSRPTIDLVKAHSRSHGNAVLAAIARLEKAQKIFRNDLEIGQKRSEKELEKVQKRLGKWSENGAKGGRPNELDKPGGFTSSRARETINHQPSTINHQESTPYIPHPEPEPATAPDPPIARGKPLAARAQDKIPEEMVAIWHASPGLPKILKLTPIRRTNLRTRFKNDFSGSIEHWQAFVTRITKSPLLMGAIPGKSWRADLDWVLKPANLIRIIEGRYDDRSSSRIVDPSPVNANSGLYRPLTAEEQAKTVWREKTPEEIAEVEAMMADFRRKKSKVA